jgi:hypothetical protein
MFTGINKANSWQRKFEMYICFNVIVCSENIDTLGWSTVRMHSGDTRQAAWNGWPDCGQQHQNTGNFEGGGGLPSFQGYCGWHSGPYWAYHISFSHWPIKTVSQRIIQTKYIGNKISLNGKTKRQS